eukprot:scaffold42690_cov60-Phaeocystis_antarctica.AAC.3
MARGRRGMARGRTALSVRDRRCCACGVGQREALAAACCAHFCAPSGSTLCPNKPCLVFSNPCVWARAHHVGASPHAK